MPKLSKSFLNANYCNYNSVFVCILIFPSEQNFPEGSEVLGSFNWKSLEPRMESSLLGNVKAICTFLQGHPRTQMNVGGQSPHSTSISARGHLSCVHILAAPHWRECCRCALFWSQTLLRAVDLRIIQWTVVESQLQGCWLAWTNESFIHQLN